MFRQHHIVGGLLLLILSVSAQAGPLINVISNRLQLSSYAKMIDGAGTPHIWEASYKGMLVDGNREVTAFNDWIYTEEHLPDTGTTYEEFAVTALSRFTGELGGFELLVESEKYAPGFNDQDTPPETYFTSVELSSLASADLRFEVSGGDVELGYWVGDDHWFENIEYPAGWTKSLSRITVYDETEEAEILDAAGNSDGWTSLLDGHIYRLHAVARDDHFPSRFMSEGFVCTGIYFTGAEVVDVPEPPVDALIALGLLSLIAGRQLGRRIPAGLQ